VGKVPSEEFLWEIDIHDMADGIGDVIPAASDQLAIGNAGAELLQERIELPWRAAPRCGLLGDLS
jgi:hypothetical protein